MPDMSLSYALHAVVVLCVGMSSCKKRFQFRTPSAYFVNHMSAYEHATRRKQGYNVSESKTLMFSNAAKTGECGAVRSDYNRNTLAVVPFYGGLPPGVVGKSKETMRVTSVGQGNSLACMKNF